MIYVIYFYFDFTDQVSFNIIEIITRKQSTQERKKVAKKELVTMAVTLNQAPSSQFTKNQTKKLSVGKRQYGQ